MAGVDRVLGDLPERGPVEDVGLEHRRRVELQILSDQTLLPADELPYLQRIVLRHVHFAGQRVYLPLPERLGAVV